MNPAKKIPPEKETDIAIIKFNDTGIKIALNKTETAKKLLEVLPVKSRVNTWGDEIYFSIPLDTELENGKEIVDIGTVAFWPPGNALCIFFGLTPASETDKPQAAGPVSIIGYLIDKNDIKYLRTVKNGNAVTVEKRIEERTGKRSTSKTSSE